MNGVMLQGFREMSKVVVQDGNWEVVSPSEFSPSGYVTHAFGIPEQRAKDWAKFYKDGVARQMAASE